MLGPSAPTCSAPSVVAARSFQEEIGRLLSGESNKPKKSPKGTDITTTQTNPSRAPTVQLIVSTLVFSELPHQLPSSSFLFFFFFRFHLFIFRGEGSEKGRERNIDVKRERLIGCLWQAPQLGIESIEPHGSEQVPHS